MNESRIMISTLSVRSSLFRFALAGALIWLTGCSSFFGKHGVFRSRGSDYLRATTIEPLALPEGVHSVQTESMYQIPPVNALDEFGDSVTLSNYSVARPESVSDKGAIGVKIQKLGGKEWLFLNASTAQVWPRTQYFLAQYDLGVETSNAAIGIIETEWLEFSDDKSNAARYRLFLEKGIHPDTTEIHILHMQYSTAALHNGDTPSWPAQSDSPERESWLLQELANTLADTVDNNAASLLGQNVGGKLKAGFTRYNNEPALSLRLSPIRAWATLTHSASQEGFKVWDSSSELGVVYVGYAPYDEDGQGFFSRLAFWRDDAKLPEEAPHSLAEILANLSTQADTQQCFAEVPGAAFTNSALRDGQGYLLLMSRSGDVAQVRIRNYRGERLPSDVTKEFLRLLRKNLI